MPRNCAQQMQISSPIAPMLWAPLTNGTIFNHKQDFLFTGLETNFSQGGVNYFLAGPNSPKLAHLRKGFIGWWGFGGSVFQWHQEHKISFAYVPTLLQPFDLMCLRGAFLQAVVLQCVESIKKGQ